MHQRPFQQVDVFTASAYAGNPVAVVLSAQGLDDARMQQFARWTNLSETTFVLPPTDAQADYRLRIFTPGGELQFAGHPTLGSCHAWLRAGGSPRSEAFVVQQCGVGLVRIARTADSLAFGAPPLQRRDADPALLAEVAAALGLEATDIRKAQLLDNGTAWLGLLLGAPDRVLGLEPDFARLKASGHKVGVAAIRSAAQHGGDAAQLEVRAFAPHLGVDEDPVTGSLNASLAQWLIGDADMPARYTAAQGARLQRAGRVDVRRDDAGQVWIGGSCVTCIDGSVTL